MGWNVQYKNREGVSCLYLKADADKRGAVIALDRFKRVWSNNGEIDYGLSRPRLIERKG